jgi:hypothetical protein
MGIAVDWDVVLETDVESFGVLANRDKINARTRLRARGRLQAERLQQTKFSRSLTFDETEQPPPTGVSRVL